MFMAYGPKFKQQVEVDSFDNVELYNLMTGDVTLGVLLPSK